MDLVLCVIAGFQAVIYFTRNTSSLDSMTVKLALVTVMALTSVVLMTSLVYVYLVCSSFHRVEVRGELMALRLRCPILVRAS